MDIVLEQRNPELFSADLKRVISYIRLKEKTQPVGSFKYKIFKYPNDIDIFERVCVKGTEREAAKKFSQRFSLLMLRLKFSNPRVYFSDFKAGYDERFSKLFSEVDTKDISKAIDTLELMFHNEIIKKKWYTECLMLLKMCIKTTSKTDLESTTAYKSLHDHVREKYIIRWTLAELTKNPPSKILTGYKEISLMDALLQNTMVKLDVWSNIDNRFVEVSNFFTLEYNDKGTIKTLSEELTAYLPSMAMDVIKYQKTNPFKSLKRMWMLSQGIQLYYKPTQEAKKMTKKYIMMLPPLFGDIPAKLSQINAQYELIKKICTTETPYECPHNKIVEQLLEILNRLRDILDETDYSDYIDLINEKYAILLASDIMIFNDVFQLKDPVTFNQKIQEYLTAIIDINDEIITELTEKFMKTNKISFKKIIKFCESYL